MPQDMIKFSYREGVELIIKIKNKEKIVDKLDITTVQFLRFLNAQIVYDEILLTEGKPGNKIVRKEKFVMFDILDYSDYKITDY